MVYAAEVMYDDDEGNPYHDTYSIDLNSFLNAAPGERDFPMCSLYRRS